MINNKSNKISTYMYRGYNVYRGGGWLVYDIYLLKSCFRDGFMVDLDYLALGFRCAIKVKNINDKK